MIRIRKETPEDIKAISEVNLLAFKKENEANLVEAIRASTFFVPDLSLVAVNEEGKVIGHILFSLLSIETETESVPTIGLAPMAVLPEHQGQGVGSALVQEGLKRCEELGYQHVVVLGHPGLYPKFGFKPSKGFGIESPFPVPDEVFMVFEVKPGALHNIMGKVKYPPAFTSVS